MALMEDVTQDDGGGWLCCGWKNLVSCCASCFVAYFGDADDFVIYLFLGGSGDCLDISTI